MGIVQWGTPCISCSRVGSVYENNNFIYECLMCQSRREKDEIKKSTQQSWWIRFLYWIVK